jgi:hypothetical protein
MTTNKFRIIDLRSDQIDPVIRFVEASSPEAAAHQVLGQEVVRSGSKKDLIARAYWQQTGHVTNMVRLYRRVGPAPV